MGAAYRTQCYPTAADAAAVECASNFPRYEGTVQTVCTVQDASHLVLTSTGGTSAVVGVAYAECAVGAEYTYLTELWGLSVLALVTLWGVKNFVLKQLANH